MRVGQTAHREAYTHRCRQRRAEHEAEVIRHYSVGSYHGKPAACLAFDLARCLQKDQPLHYWCGVDGGYSMVASRCHVYQ